MELIPIVSKDFLLVWKKEWEVNIVLLGKILMIGKFNLHFGKDILGKVSSRKIMKMFLAVLKKSQLNLCVVCILFFIIK
jgi:hypothetical protein